MTNEIVAMWAALTIYAASAVLFVLGVVFEKDRLIRLGFALALAGLVPHTIALGIRWVRTGHGPYRGWYEAVSGLGYVSVATFAVLGWRQPRLKAIGIALMPVGLLLMAAAMLAPMNDRPLTPSLASYWLIIHVAFAKLAVGTFVASFALAVIYLLRERSAGVWQHRLQRLPEQNVVDDLSYRFALSGFLFWGIMMATGAIWANEAWGRYWAWDPIETWTLIVWLVYAAYLHVRLSLGWRGEKTAWFAAAAMPIALFCLMGVPLLYRSVHAAYLRR